MSSCRGDRSDGGTFIKQLKPLMPRPATMDAASVHPLENRICATDACAVFLVLCFCMACLYAESKASLITKNSIELIINPKIAMRKATFNQCSGRNYMVYTVRSDVHCKFSSEFTEFTNAKLNSSSIIIITKMQGQVRKMKIKSTLCLDDLSKIRNPCNKPQKCQIGRINSYRKEFGR